MSTSVASVEREVNRATSAIVEAIEVRKVYRRGKEDLVVLQDLNLTIHPHPTLSESVGMAAEVGTGTITDLPPKRRKTPR